MHSEKEAVVILLPVYEVTTPFSVYKPKKGETSGVKLSGGRLSCLPNPECTEARCKGSSVPHREDRQWNWGQAPLSQRQAGRWPAGSRAQPATSHWSQDEAGASNPPAKTNLWELLGQQIVLSIQAMRQDRTGPPTPLSLAMVWVMIIITIPALHAPYNHPQSS